MRAQLTCCGTYLFKLLPLNPSLCCAADEASTSADARMMIGVKGSELYDGFSTKKDKQVILGLFA